jgi:hypothetical protein
MVASSGNVFGAGDELNLAEKEREQRQCQTRGAKDAE